MSDEKLIGEAQNGNKSALNTLILNNYDVLSGYVLKLTGNADEASDVINDTIVKVVLNVEKYKPTGKFSTWMITIATNIYRDNLKKKKRFVSLEGYEEISKVDVEEEIITKLDYENILMLLKELPKEKRAVFILKHYYNYKYEEISEILKCPIGTVRSRLHYSVKYLMRRLEGGNN
ncbi:RNA polymerase sigma factor, sigma-70 family protein [Clostridium argentinense CDC 2741]|uniref:RNA polymerase sigma factor, sigma-70 family protein n=1 Tax=Clostridium argentinense CDC 2741 TaxID=1418104 RepID=A0A0C1TWG1_9CLOT|nr:RNA polymerase sigma factor SigY [Clostridium argentinense]ARC84201.1 RNA polymerase sigma factor SigY [Clostridium argentinense]KIE45044.1 RNA polymerase sigma factor, sigma-70 family protein [Clostridium argentinense CDC 2741]NFF38152.1 RNA polymerase sigma factor SigY [Clostridium argentinense]NFP51183.1 RNA polymerase sigma factor SigY [Clostridium argentinense]NFP71458.1 RNA polymerase sigma factor SigY [Clostridium argentinense]